MFSNFLEIVVKSKILLKKSAEREYIYMYIIVIKIYIRLQTINFSIQNIILKYLEKNNNK